MKIDCALSATNEKYAHCAPFFVKFWKKLFPEIDVKVIFVGEKIPEVLNPIRENLIFLDTSTPIFKELKTPFLAQNCRLYYPALLNYEGAVLISDIDMFPMNRAYYEEPIKNLASDFFVTYRFDYFMCYNAAPPKVWGDIFNITSLEDCHKALSTTYPKGYGGGRGTYGWYNDQSVLASKVKSWSKYKTHHAFNIESNLSRLECSHLGQHLVEENIRNLRYTDLHLNCLNPQDVDTVYSSLPNGGILK